MSLQAPWAVSASASGRRRPRQLKPPASSDYYLASGVLTGCSSASWPCSVCRGATTDRCSRQRRIAGRITQLGVCARHLRTRLLHREEPPDGDPLGVPAVLPRAHLVAQRGDVPDSAIQTDAGQVLADAYIRSFGAPERLTSTLLDGRATRAFVAEHGGSFAGAVARAVPPDPRGPAPAATGARPGSPLSREPVRPRRDGSARRPPRPPPARVARPRSDLDVDRRSRATPQPHPRSRGNARSARSRAS